MASSATLDIARLQLGPVITNAKGAKSAAFTINGTVVYWAPGQYVCPFEAKSFDGSDASRVSVCLRPDSDLQDQLMCLDHRVLTLAKENSVALFGKDLSGTTLEDKYQSCLKTSETHAPLLRCKINLTGTRPCKYWDPTGRRAEPLDSWAGALVTPRICVKGLWMNSGQFGCVLEIHDARVEEPDVSCPF
jgi:hypothetical protein